MHHFCNYTPWCTIPCTPPFPPDSCYLYGAPCQTIIRRLSDACQMSHQTSVNSHQTSVRQVPHMYHMPTRHILCHMYIRRLPDIYQTNDVQFRLKSIPIQFQFRPGLFNSVPIQFLPSIILAQFSSNSNSTLENIGSIQFQFNSMELSIPIPIPSLTP